MVLTQPLHPAIAFRRPQQRAQSTSCNVFLLVARVCATFSRNLEAQSPFGQPRWEYGRRLLINPFHDVFWVRYRRLHCRWSAGMGKPVLLHGLGGTHLPPVIHPLSRMLPHCSGGSPRILTPCERAFNAF